ncbi:anillin [Dendroctonus ponderosae]|nr:anillin [Dendroctonus ponderosae]KAH1017696.1 hypothetical protein HUJ05_008301 [Dendroctonus ponderosae]
MPILRTTCSSTPKTHEAAVGSNDKSFQEYHPPDFSSRSASNIGIYESGFFTSSCRFSAWENCQKSTKLLTSSVSSMSKRSLSSVNKGALKASFSTCRLSKKGAKDDQLETKFVVNAHRSQSMGKFDNLFNRNKIGRIQKKLYSKLDGKGGGKYSTVHIGKTNDRKWIMESENEDSFDSRCTKALRKIKEVKLNPTTSIQSVLDSYLNLNSTGTVVDAEDLTLTFAESEGESNENERLDQIYKSVKLARDIQCLKMAEASKVLQEIRLQKENIDWVKILIAEALLLQTSEKVQLLNEQIVANNFSLLDPPLLRSTLRLCNIKFPFLSTFRAKPKLNRHFTDFFLLTVAHDKQMLMSEYITGEINPLKFKREFRLFSVTPDFRIRIKLFCLKMRTSEELFWEKLNWGLCSTSKIIYQNHLTHQYEEKTVLQPSFKLCADATLTSEHINQSSAALNLDTYVFHKLEGLVEFDLSCDCVNKNVMLSGFLDMGTFKGGSIFWDRRWCILRGCNIWLYNYPQDELWGNSVDRINLEYCVGPLATKVENCLRKRSFRLKTYRATDLNQEDNSMPSHELRTYYFSALHSSDYKKWTIELERLIVSLKAFKKLKN